MAPDLYTSPGEVSATANDVATDTAAADALMQRCEHEVAAGNISAAVQLATAAVTQDHNHAAARRVLGYRNVTDASGKQAWCGAYAERRLKRGEVWHSQFGWIKHADLARWEAGNRPAARRWVSAKVDADRHATIARGWQVRTDHFLIITNHSREAGVDLAQRLESLHQVWRQLFAQVEFDKRDLQVRLEGNQPTGHRRRPFRVIYHRTRDEYNQHLKQRQDQIGQTLGIYFDTVGESHFFAGKDQHPGTIYHEAVHQFFYETYGKNRRFARIANAWAVEGVACYFESLQPANQPVGIAQPTSPKFALGRPSAGRLPAAIQRRLVDDYYVPLEELSGLGMLDLQKRSDLPRLYSQSAGLATFLMEYENGKYAPAFAELLEAIYAGRDQASTLRELTGQSWETLDRQYREYLTSLTHRATHQLTPAATRTPAQPVPGLVAE